MLQSRNRFRRVVAAVALVVLASGCSGTPADRKNTLSMGLDGIPEILAPASTTSPATYVLTNQIFDPLVRLAPDSGQGIVPALATSWTISPDGVTYSFRLREGVTFHDGEPFNAAAVVLNYERLTNTSARHYWPVGGKVATAQVLKFVKSVQATGDLSVDIHLVAPYPDFLDNLARPYFMFVSPRSIRDLAPEAASLASIGTGPYRLAERSGDSLIRLAAFDGYYEGRPNVDEVLIRPFSDRSALVAALESGEVDMITSASYDEIGRLGGRFDAWGFGTEDAYLIAFNTRHPFVSDVRVRQALNYAVDKSGMVKGLFGGQVKEAVGPFSASNAAFNADRRPPYAHDPAKAKALLAEAGFANGTTVKAIIPSDSGIPMISEMAQTIQADWKKVGVNVEFDTVEWNAYLGIVGGGLPDKYIFYVTQWGATYPGWLELLHGKASLPPNGPNRGYYVNDQVEALFNQARAEGNSDTRVALYRQAEDLIVRDAPWLYTVYVRTTGLKSSTVQGIRNEMVSFDLAKVAVKH
jgi:peptide/nickel transport system substrate-binding protein